MENRVIAIGDIHGHRRALDGLLKLIAPQPEDTLVFLGDYVDRGPDSSGVIQRVLDLKDRCHVIALQGNHEEMFLNAWTDQRCFNQWISNGGDAALRNYDGNLENVPSSHKEFLESLLRYYEVDHFFFIHANYAPNWKLEDHNSRTALWTGLDDLPTPHYSGKTAVVGHTPQMTGEILDVGHLLGIDTGCGFGGLLTALDVIHGDIWQVNEQGEEVL